MVTTLFLDTEFTALTQKAELISFALAGDNGREFYAEFTDYTFHKLSRWHQKNVIAALAHSDFLSDSNSGSVRVKGDHALILGQLEEWLSGFERVEMWADVLAWDWVLFCELFGGAFNIPANIYYIPFDLATLLRLKGLDPDMDRAAFINYKDKDGLSRHNALYDARMEFAVYQKLMM